MVRGFSVWASGGVGRCFVAFAVMLGVSFGLTSCGVVADGGEGDELGHDEQPSTTYDLVPKPIPSSYLKLKMTSNRCCTGLNATYPNCANDCADANGLVTSAGVAKAPEYYEATGQRDLTTLELWKDYFGFPKRQPAETLDAYRLRTKAVVYYNRTELGLGRDLGCTKNANGIACYVTNYGTTFDSVHDLGNPDALNPDGSTNALWDAIIGRRPKNTVVISWSRAREWTPNDGRAVQFAAFGPDGTRLNKAQLDTMGARPIPQICMTCHGGVWDADSRATNGTGQDASHVYYGIARYARFLPLVTSTVTFSGSAPYRLSDQEEAIRVVNEYAYKARGDAVAGEPSTGGSLTSRQMTLMGWLYSTNPGATPIDGTLSFQASTPGRQYAENAWPVGWSTRQAVYNVIALPYCDTCHMAMQPFAASGNRPGQAGTTYTWLTSLANMQTNAATLGTFMGVNASGYLGRANLMMPHAQNAFARFWGDASTFDGSCFLNGAYRPKAECFLVEIGLWPGGRPANATFSSTNPLTNLLPVNGGTGQYDCGQPVVSSSGTTTGIDSGRRTASVNVGGNTFINQCTDGCVAGQVYCPGADSAGDPAASRYPGARQECRPLSPNSNYGKCVSCGLINQEACTQIGANCRADMNPLCTSQPACHEGVQSGAWCDYVSLATGKTATQSSTAFGGVASRAVDGNYDGTYNNGSVTHTNNARAWWQVDLGANKNISWIMLYNRTDCCYTRLSDFVVEYATNSAGPFTVFTGGNFGGVAPTNSGVVYIDLPKRVNARYVKVRLLSGSILSLTEVVVAGG